MCFFSKISITFYEIVNIICQRLTIINIYIMITIVTTMINQIITLEKIIIVKSLIAMVMLIIMEILTRIVNGEYLS